MLANSKVIKFSNFQKKMMFFFKNLFSFKIVGGVTFFITIIHIQI
jgi:hypothetical protein